MGKRSFFYLPFLLGTSLFAQESSKSFERKNLGPNINTKYTEMTPRISADGKTLFFVREGDPKNKNQQDVWISNLGEDGHWKPAQRADKTLNRVEGNCVWSVSPDGNSVLVRGAFVQGNFVGRGFSLTRLTKDGWTDPEMLQVAELDKMDHGDNDGASISVDGNAIVFTMCEKTNCHNYDLYVSTKKEDGTFTKPARILTNVNTTSNEFAPFIASDNRTLYFSSDRPGGLGKSDIYKAERQDSTWTNWGEPTNLGSTINTVESDGYYSTDAKGEYAYLVSSLNSIGSADIIKIKLSKEHMARPVALLDGIIYNAKTKKIIDATVEYNVYPDDTDEGIAHTDHLDGSYKLVLPYGENYAVNISAKGYVPYYDTISLKEGSTYREIKRDYYLTPIEVGQSVVLKHIYFETGKYDLLTDSYYELDKIVKLLNDNKHMEIEVGGHTDDIGLDDDNQLLSQNRAIAVMNYLVSKGIGLNRLRAIGYGEKNPLVANDTDENRKLNRRVEFIIKKK